jgi:hypothetical protein
MYRHTKTNGTFIKTSPSTSAPKKLAWVLKHRKKRPANPRLFAAQPLAPRAVAAKKARFQTLKKGPDPSANTMAHVLKTQICKELILQTNAQTRFNPWRLKSVG